MMKILPLLKLISIVLEMNKSHYLNTITKELLTENEIKIIIDKLDNITNNNDLMSDLERLQWEEWERKSIEQDLINTSMKKGLKKALPKEFLKESNKVSPKAVNKQL